MKKYLRYADVLTLFLGVVGLLLHLLLKLGGTDERGLYPAHHPAWIGLCVLSLLVVAVLFLITKQAGTEDRYAPNFSRSVPGAVGCGLAAVGVLVTAVDTLSTDVLSLVVAVLGMAGAAGLAVAAYCRAVGKKPHFACFAALCGFFALRVFLLGRVLGAEPEACRYLFELLASLAMAPACYYLWGFAVDLGNRSKSLFWSLTAAYICMVAVLYRESWLLHASCAVFLLSNLCPLQIMDKLPEPAEAEESSPESAQIPAEAEE